LRCCMRVEHGEDSFLRRTKGDTVSTQFTKGFMCVSNVIYIY
jgi:hypothetical protein